MQWPSSTFYLQYYQHRLMTNFQLLRWAQNIGLIFTDTVTLTNISNFRKWEFNPSHYAFIFTNNSHLNDLTLVSNC